ncbi:MAG: pyruvate, phosphate dikinase [Gemmatimonadetes bacterium]|nr:pyruvate, phosphate dikinase [Gemmatimonadota bacterium]
MSTAPRPLDDVLVALQDRAKELDCLYRVVELLAREHEPRDLVLQQVLTAIPAGWQYAQACQAQIVFDGHSLATSPGLLETPWRQRAPIQIGNRVVGELNVYYTAEQPPADEGPFLREERQLINALAERIGAFLEQRQRAPLDGATHTPPERGRDWRLVVDFLERVDPRLLEWITRKMLYHVRWKGGDVAEIAPETTLEPDLAGADNRPLAVPLPSRSVRPRDVFAFAATLCSDEEILNCIQMWISHDRISFLIRTLEQQGASLGQTADALARFAALGMSETQLPHSVQTAIRVALLRRFFTDDIAFINIAKDLVHVRDFHRLSERLIAPPNSHGKLGGKSAGLFLAQRIVEESLEHERLLAQVKVPRTWYIASDGVLAFIRHNNLEDVYDRKYMDIDQVRQQYPHVVQSFKSASFPPELVTGLIAALRDLGDRPLIVRSSSLLEDRTGAVFSGKYKSLFLANRGSEAERLQALQDAVAEVYASIFGPDPIEYRAEHNLLDVHEEMGIMIQEVVGRHVGRYFLPAYAGVAFSNNEFRWSPRIRREDGLIRLVPGLGTRAVDRLTDEFPVLLAPGQPGLRASISMDEIIRYAPRNVDLIDLDSNSFETLPIAVLLRECGTQLPLLRRIVSVIDHDRVRRLSAFEPDFGTIEAVVTFDGLCTETSFIPLVATLLRVLRARLGGPVDIEFASDGTHFYLLQCRPQCYATSSPPSVIPHDVPAEHVLFSAQRFVSNGRAPDVRHIVYVDPARYGRLATENELRAEGRAVGRLNKVLGRRDFVLMGPGRWGSRGDIRLGVTVTYSEINNAAVLIEIARRTGNYVPDLSFGTHFFQDLVEAQIPYLPLYPDEPGNRFNERFLAQARNLLPELLPDLADLEQVVRVIDVTAESGGRRLRVLFNGDADEALGFLTPLPGETQLT